MTKYRPSIPSKRGQNLLDSDDLIPEPDLKLTCHQLSTELLISVVKKAYSVRKPQAQRRLPMASESILLLCTRRRSLGRPLTQHVDEVVISTEQHPEVSRYGVGASSMDRQASRQASEQTGCDVYRIVWPDRPHEFIDPRVIVRRWTGDLNLFAWMGQPFARKVDRWSRHSHGPF